MTVDEEAQEVERLDGLPESGDPADLAVIDNPLHDYYENNAAGGAMHDMEIPGDYGDQFYGDESCIGAAHRDSVSQANGLPWYESSYGEEAAQQQGEEEDAAIAMQIRRMSSESSRLMQSMRDGEGTSPAPSASIQPGNHPPAEANTLSPMMESFIVAHSARGRRSLTGAGKRSSKTKMTPLSPPPQEISMPVNDDREAV